MISTYHENLLPLTRDELVSRVQAALSKGRFEHVLRVEETAVKLANQYGVDEEKASVAALCHDYAKERPDADFLKVIDEKHLGAQVRSANNAIWHGVVGAEMVKDELGVYDEDILNAIRLHTTGGVYMTKLAQVLYMADFIEPGRDFPGVETARQITDQDLGLGVAYQTAHTLEYLIEQHVAVYPATLETYNAWVPKYGKELRKWNQKNS